MKTNMFFYLPVFQFPSFLSNSKNIVSLLIILLLTACTSTEKPHYILTDSEVYRYQGGETLNYGIISLNSDATGTLTYSFEPEDLIAPITDNSTISTKTLLAFSRNTRIEGALQFPFPTPYFTQTDTGDWMLEAYLEAGKIFWLSDNDTRISNTVFYPSPLSELLQQTSINKTLITYENKILSASGSTNLTISPLGVETIETSYATFETYKLNIDWTVTTQDGEQKNFAVNGTQWVYPPLGVVKFQYDFNSSGILGTLSATNIKIAKENKLAK